MTTPIRIQRKRTKGWRMPPNTIYVGRPTKWGNPYKYIEPRSLDFMKETVRWYRRALYLGHLSVDVSDVIRELEGKNLACWCPLDQPCHADILLRIANLLSCPFCGEKPKITIGDLERK